ncbi:MAG: FAD-dependent oxidoreductase, partial [Coriobacteriia bacterium]|nr:FAD-dependent oxidoreductase [Coriobacteriia bacterium]
MASEAGERSVSRRDFLKKTGVLAAGVAAAGLVGCDDGNEEDKPIGGPSSNIDLENVTWDVSGDVVVVGGGGAGCSCALAAAEAGLTVILLESSAALGGCTALAVGSLTTPGSQMQRDKGITDSAEAYLEDAKRMIGESGVARSGEDWAIFEMQAAEGGKTIDWLVEHGVTFNGPFVYPGHTNDRMHMLTPNTSAWPGILQPQMEAAGVRIFFDTKGMELIVDDGRVVGVMAIDQITKQELYFRGARGVFIATASIDASYEMKIKAYADPDIAAGDASCAFNDGQGLRMCQKIGADLTGWDSPAGQSLRAQAPSVNVGVYGKQSWMPFGMITAGAIMVTKQGKRYASEDIGGQEMS